jgi:hypothetical protein
MIARYSIKWRVLICIAVSNSEPTVSHAWVMFGCRLFVSVGIGEYFPEPEFPHPVFRAVSPLAFVRWFVAAVVPAPTLEPVTSQQIWSDAIFDPTMGLYFVMLITSRF